MQNAVLSILPVRIVLSICPVWLFYRRLSTYTDGWSLYTGGGRIFAFTSLPSSELVCSRVRLIGPARRGSSDHEEDESEDEVGREEQDETCGGWIVGQTNALVIY